MCVFLLHDHCVAKKSGGNDGRRRHPLFELDTYLHKFNFYSLFVVLQKVEKSGIMICLLFSHIIDHHMRLAKFTRFLAVGLWCDDDDDDDRVVSKKSLLRK